MLKPIALIVLVLMGAAGCAGPSADALKPGMSTKAAFRFLERERFVVKEETGAQIRRSFQISSDASGDALVFVIEEDE